MAFNKKDFMRKYMRKRRAAHPELEEKYRQNALKRKLGALIDEMSVSDLERILQQKKERLASTQEGKREE